MGFKGRFFAVWFYAFFLYLCTLRMIRDLSVPDQLGFANLPWQDICLQIVQLYYENLRSVENVFRAH